MIPKWLGRSSRAPVNRILVLRFFKNSSQALPGAAVPHTTPSSRSSSLSLRRGDLWFRLGYVLIGVIIFVFLTLFLLPDHAALYLEILKALGIFGAGAAGGYGLRAYQDRRPDQPRDS